MTTASMPSASLDEPKPAAVPPKKHRVKKALDDFYAFMDQPIALWSRPVLALLVVFLAFAITKPLWHITLVAPQYADGLRIDIFAYTLKGGHDDGDIIEFNILNHYVGMQKLDRTTLSELDWLPFGFGALAILTLRVAAIGNVRSLLDLSVIVTYFTGFSLARFIYKLYVYGHNLSPDAPIKVPPFTPAIWGSKTIGNFTSHAEPGTGTYLMGAFAIGVLGLTLYHLIAGRIRAKRAARVAA